MTVIYICNPTARLEATAPTAATAATAASRSAPSAAASGTSATAATTAGGSGGSGGSGEKDLAANLTGIDRTRRKEMGTFMRKKTLARSNLRS